MKRIRVVLADDHPLTLDGLRAFLEPQFECVGAVGDGRALVEATLLLKPDLVVLDITMPLLNGIDAAIQIRKQMPAAKILFVTMHLNPAYVEAALHAGGTGYVLKSAAREELLDAIQCVLRGGTYVTPALSTENRLHLDGPSHAADGLRLSPREREILQLLAEGRPSKEMAHLLNISVKTIAFHRDNIKKKLGLRSTAELTRHAIQQGLV